VQRCVEARTVAGARVVELDAVHLCSFMHQMLRSQRFLQMRHHALLIFILIFIRVGVAL